MKTQKGFVAISIVLLTTVVLVGIITTVALLGIGEGQVGLAHADGEQELALVEGCMEQALLNVKNNAAYTGGSIGQCIIAVSGTYTVTATSANSAYHRSVQTVFTRTTQINLTSWQEI